MGEARQEEFAELIATYSLDLEEGDDVYIRYDDSAQPLVDEVYTRICDQGADPGYGAPASPDHVLTIRAPTGGDDEPLPDSEMRLEENGEDTSFSASGDWCLTYAPTEFMAERAGMEYDEFEDFFYDSVLRDWEKAGEDMVEVKKRLDEGSEVRIIGEETDLSFSIEVRSYLNRVGEIGDGEENLPAGEVYTAPIAETVDGEIYFDTSIYYNGQELSGVRLSFDEGELVDFDAEEGYDQLYAKLMDRMNCRVGEFGIGTNFQIGRTTGSVIFDEKIGGTVHLALGSNYRETFAIATDHIDRRGMDEDECENLISRARDEYYEGSYKELLEQHDGAEEDILREWHEALEEATEEYTESVNDTDFHLDLVKDLRDGGEVRIDGEPILRDGSFVGVASLP
jgi:leucyl aminopeptidase (aminopeptidase T)